jgi:hypothetical protein
MKLNIETKVHAIIRVHPGLYKMQFMIGGNLFGSEQQLTRNKIMADYNLTESQFYYLFYTSKNSNGTEYINHTIL